MATIPAVSEENWQLTKAYAQAGLGTVHMSPDELSFSKQLDLALPELEGETLEELHEKIRTDKAASRKWETWPEGLTVIYENADEGRVRRPEVPDEVAAELTAVVDAEYEGVPVEELHFDRMLDLLYKRMRPVDRFLNVYVLRDDEVDEYPDAPDEPVIRVC